MQEQESCASESVPLCQSRVITCDRTYTWTHSGATDSDKLRVAVALASHFYPRLDAAELWNAFTRGHYTVAGCPQPDVPACVCVRVYACVRACERASERACVHDVPQLARTSSRATCAAAAACRSVLRFVPGPRPSLAALDLSVRSRGGPDIRTSCVTVCRQLHMMS